MFVFKQLGSREIHLALHDSQCEGFALSRDRFLDLCAILLGVVPTFGSSPRRRPANARKCTPPWPCCRSTASALELNIVLSMTAKPVATAAFADLVSIRELPKFVVVAQAITSLIPQGQPQIAVGNDEVPNRLHLSDGASFVQLALAMPLEGSCWRMRPSSLRSK